MKPYLSQIVVTFTLFVILMSEQFFWISFISEEIVLFTSTCLCNIVQEIILSGKRENTWYDRGQENWNISISWKKTKTKLPSTFPLKMLSRFKLNNSVTMKIQSRMSIFFVALIIFVAMFSNVVDAASTQPRCTDDELVNFLIFKLSN